MEFMTATLHWSDLPKGLHGEMSQDRLMSLGSFTCWPSVKVMAWQLLLPIFCIVNSQSVPIFEEVLSRSG
jgi:hypothetical protein